MKIEAVCFSGRGEELGRRLQGALSREGERTGLTRCGDGGPRIADWAAANFSRADALVFIGAVGIAVRAVAPLIVSKTTDPAVIVIDDGGRFVIPLLSGHIGGANALALRIAGMLQATPVVTTATDVHGVFAVDSWAVSRGMAIMNSQAIKSVSGKLLAGETVRVKSCFPVTGSLPAGVELADDGYDVLISILASSDSDPRDSKTVLQLVPRTVVLGVGCRKGAEGKAIGDAFEEICASAGIVPEAVCKVCSIDLKKDEPGLLAFCEQRRLPFETFDAARLAAIPGDFTASAFVEKTTGVDNVCERSAIAGGGTRLLAGKTVGNGVAMALAIGEYTVDFSQQERECR